MGELIPSRPLTRDTHLGGFAFYQIGFGAVRSTRAFAGAAGRLHAPLIYIYPAQPGNFIRTRDHGLARRFGDHIENGIVRGL